VCLLVRFEPMTLTSIRHGDVTLLLVGLLATFGQRAGHAQAPDALPFSKSYSITGNYVVGGVDLAPASGANGFITGTIPTRATATASTSPRRRRRIVRGLRSDHLERDGDAELGVPRPIHGAHAADADRADDVVARPERLADREWTDR